MMFLLLLLITTIQSFQILPYLKQPYLNSNLLLKYKSTMQTVKSYSDINLKTIHNKSQIFKIESTKSFIFNDEIISQIYPFETSIKQSKFIEISYKDSKRNNITFEWIKFSKCIPNNSKNRATYRQSWSIDLGSGITFRLDFSSFLGGIGPTFKNENNLDFGIGGSIVCEVEPGHNLQFAIFIESFDIENVKFREVKFSKLRLKKNYEKNTEKGWKKFPKYKLVNKNNIQLACFIDPELQNC